MEADAPSPQENKADTLLSLVKGPLAASAARLAAQSRAIPSGRDFHFYHSFDQFRGPSREIAARSKSLLSALGSSASLFGGGRVQPEGAAPQALPEDLDDAHDWLVNLNDEILERFGSSMDEVKTTREREEGGPGRERSSAMESGGFQMVYGKKGKKKRDACPADADVGEGAVEAGGAPAVKVASRDKKTTAPRSQVPFHIPTIPRPQDEFMILVNNSNLPFEHVWLERSEDGSGFIHPLEKLSVLDFVDGNIEQDEPVKPPPIENTPFKLVEGVKELKELAAKLRNVDEFAVDLEHNHYRSFQGLTCSMQISTRTEDFIVDTLKLRVHVGPHLREVFKDPSKRKVMHGADRDILWLQRDFGIYVCNLFDTGQASRILQLERNSLEFLLHYYCGFTANKEYQQADWRLRPLPDDMLKYAREDTHYLLYIYDMMKRKLLSESSNSELGDSLLAEVYKRSYDVGMQLYEKELLTDTSYLRIYGLNEFDFNSQQLAVVAGLCEWRDRIARNEDESTGYILPNRTLLEIARQMPLTSGMLKRLLRSKHTYVERHLSLVVDIIRRSIGNAAAFEAASELLKKGHPIAAANEEVGDDPESPAVTEEQAIAEAAVSKIKIVDGAGSPEKTEEVTRAMVVRRDALRFGASSDRAVISNEEKMSHGVVSPLQSAKAVNIASVDILKKPTGAFGALFGNSSTKRKVELDPKGRNSEQDKADRKLGQIKSTFTLPFHSYSGGVLESRLGSDRTVTNTGPQHEEAVTHQETEPRVTDDIIPLTDESDVLRTSTEAPVNGDGLNHRWWFPQLPQGGSAASSGAAGEDVGRDESMSLAELSSSFRKCFQATGQTQSPKETPRAGTYAPFQPFDYATARREVRFGGVAGGGESAAEGDDPRTAAGASTTNLRGRRKGAALGTPIPGTAVERSRDFQPPRRCQAFPASGNRSATFR